MESAWSFIAERDTFTAGVTEGPGAAELAPTLGTFAARFLGVRGLGSAGFGRGCAGTVSPAAAVLFRAGALRRVGTGTSSGCASKLDLGLDSDLRVVGFFSFISSLSRI